MTNVRSTAGPAADPGADPYGDHVPGAGTLAVLALAWLLAMLSSARLALGSSPDADPLTVTRAALELPQVISASLIAGVAVGLAVMSLGRRLAPGALARAGARYGIAGAAGAVTGLAVAIPILLGYGGLPSILLLSGTVATAAMLGGLLSALRHRMVVAAGATGALGVFVLVLLERIFEADLRRLFGAGDSAESVVTASSWVVLTASIMGGLVAGALGYVYLRRCDRPELRWPAYLLAGALPGLLMLLAEVVTRLGGARLFSLVSAASADDDAVLRYFNAARFNRTLIVVFVGALVAIVLLGRTLRPAAEPDEPGNLPTAADPATAHDDLATAHDDLVTAQDDRATAQDNPAAAQDDPATVEDDPAAAQPGSDRVPGPPELGRPEPAR